MNAIRRRLPLLLPISAWLGGVFIFFRQFFLSGGDLVTGGPGDGQLITSLHEHWFRFARGLEGWHEMIFFYPAKNVLGYSDTFLLTGIPYTVLRFFGLDPYLSLQLVLISLSSAGFWGMYYWLRQFRQTERGLATFLAGLFLVASPIYLASRNSHPQLLSVWLLPVYLILMESILLRLWRGEKGVALLFAMFAALFGLLTYSTFYVAYFFALLVFLGLLGSLVLFGLRRSFAQAWERRKRWTELLPGLGILALFAALFLKTYLPALQETGGRPFEAVVSHLPLPWDLFNHSTTNALWGKLAEAIWSYPAYRPHEVELGMPPLLFFSVVAYALYLLVIKRRIFSLERLAAFVFLSGTLLLVRVDGFSLWSIPWLLLPGAEGIRAAFRFNLVLLLPALLLLMHLTQSLWKEKSWKRRVPLALLGLFLILEQAQFSSNARMSREERGRLVDKAAAPPAELECFYAFMPSDRDDRPGLRRMAQNAAIRLAENWNLPTINGRSGFLPAGWRLMGMHPSTAWPALQKWVEAKEVRGPVGLYDLDRQQWIRIYRPEPVPPGPFVGLNLLSLPPEQFAEMDPVNWSGQEFWGRWTLGEQVSLKLPKDRFPTGNYRVVLSGRAFVPPGSAALNVAVLIGEEVIGKLQLQDKGKETTVWFPAKIKDGQRTLRFRQNPRSPRDFGGKDNRILGLGVGSLRLLPIPED